MVLYRPLIFLRLLHCITSWRECNYCDLVLVFEGAKSRRVKAHRTSYVWVVNSLGFREVSEYRLFPMFTSDINAFPINPSSVIWFVIFDKTSRTDPQWLPSSPFYRLYRSAIWDVRNVLVFPRVFVDRRVNAVSSTCSGS